MPLAAPLPVAAIDAPFAAWDRPDSPGCALGIIRDVDAFTLTTGRVRRLRYARPSPEAGAATSDGPA